MLLCCCCCLLAGCLAGYLAGWLACLAGCLPLIRFVFSSPPGRPDTQKLAGLKPKSWGEACLDFDISAVSKSSGGCSFDRVGCAPYPTTGRGLTARATMARKLSIINYVLSGCLDGSIAQVSCLPRGQSIRRCVVRR